eukprot:scaffold434_cov186-Pinguiococcus_pyrenoidosus.AAC.83
MEMQKEVFQLCCTPLLACSGQASVREPHVPLRRASGLSLPMHRRSAAWLFLLRLGDWRQNAVDELVKVVPRDVSRLLIDDQAETSAERKPRRPL